MRGGRVALQDITKPTTVEWGTPLQAMVTVLDLERKVRQGGFTEWTHYTWL